VAAKHPPRSRPYRIALVTIFFVVAGVPAILFFRSVVGSLFDARARPVAAPPGPGAAGCVARAEALRQELSDHLDGLRALASREGSSGLRHWQAFTLRFEAHLEAERDRCHTSARAAPLFDALDALLRVADRTATRLLTESGDDLRTIDATFARAREQRDTP
jgi:hypothetical protein